MSRRFQLGVSLSEVVPVTGSCSRYFIDCTSTDLIVNSSFDVAHYTSVKVCRGSPAWGSQPVQHFADAAPVFDSRGLAVGSCPEVSAEGPLAQGYPPARRPALGSLGAVFGGHPVNLAECGLSERLGGAFALMCIVRIGMDRTGMWSRIFDFKVRFHDGDVRDHDAISAGSVANTTDLEFTVYRGTVRKRLVVPSSDLHFGAGGHRAVHRGGKWPHEGHSGGRDRRRGAGASSAVRAADPARSGRQLPRLDAGLPREHPRRQGLGPRGAVGPAEAAGAGLRGRPRALRGPWRARARGDHGLAGEVPGEHRHVGLAEPTLAHLAGSVLRLTARGAPHAGRTGAGDCGPAAGIGRRRSPEGAGRPSDEQAAAAAVSPVGARRRW
ncbi:unnamed protein product [Prorocentrum cordatum]|uniref:Uncharacterized protein n=1 Tax=Prorocentrum cordatum TaxID=2364126 RepID=A0ABN9XE76_9DINO|nr:unnamed protein product [Polarella glacialis]